MQVHLYLSSVSKILFLPYNMIVVRIEEKKRKNFVFIIFYFLSFRCFPCLFGLSPAWQNLKLSLENKKKLKSFKKFCLSELSFTHFLVSIIQMLLAIEILLGFWFLYTDYDSNTVWCVVCGDNNLHFEHFYGNYSGVNNSGGSEL